MWSKCSPKAILETKSTPGWSTPRFSLLGAMFITNLQLASMNRVDMPLSQRREFFLYVDEFQNFATASFIKILSEARKFGLGVVLANQYIDQIPLELQYG